MQDDQNQSNDEWQQLQNDWQSYQPDIAKIKKKIAWVTWRMIAVLALDVLVVITYIPFLIFYVFPEDNSIAMKAWHFAMFPVLMYGVYIDFKLRLPLFKLESQSTEAILRFYLKRVKAGIVLGQWGYRFSVLLLGLFVVWVVSNYLFEWGEAKLEKTSTIVFGMIWISFFAGIMHWYRIRKTKEAKRLQALWKEFLE